MFSMIRANCLANYDCTNGNNHEMKLFENIHWLYYPIMHYICLFMTQFIENTGPLC